MTLDEASDALERFKSDSPARFYLYGVIDALRGQSPMAPRGAPAKAYADAYMMGYNDTLGDVGLIPLTDLNP